MELQLANAGPLPSVPTVAEVRFSAIQQLTGLGPPFCQLDVPAMSSGEMTSISGSCTLPNLPPGDGWFAGWLDSNLLIDESNELNNVVLSEQPFTVMSPSPDLQVTNFFVDTDMGYPGGPLVFSICLLCTSPSPRDRG